jgi:methionyl-tRNA formyltransferase
LPAAGAATPGTVLAADASGIELATGEGRLRLLELQRPGGRRMAVADFLRGFSIAPGTRLDPPHTESPATSASA